MKNINVTLQQHVVLACENLPECAFSGPFVFFTVAKCIVSTTQNLSHNVNNELLVVSLCNFEGEDVIKCVFILRNILRFLNCGIPGFDCTPPLLMDHLFNILMTASNTQFCNHIQNLKNFDCVNVNAPEALFVCVQDYHSNITTKPGAVWLKTKKSKAAFTAGTPSQHQPVGTTSQQVTQPAPAPAPALLTQGSQPGG